MPPREESSGAPPPSRRRWVPLLVFGAAALLYATVWQLPALFPRHPVDGVLLLSRQEGGEWVELQEGVEVPAHARIRFGVRLQRPASVVLLGLNAQGHATLYAPAQGAPPRLREGVSSLLEQALDGVPGPELFLAVLCNTPLSSTVILKAGERALATAGTPSQVQSLDLGCPEARFQVVKESAR